MSALASTKTRAEFLGKVASSFPIIWVDTIEYERVITEFTKTVQSNLTGKNFYKWDIIGGLTQAMPNDDGEYEIIEDNVDGPAEVIAKVASLDSTVIFAQDFHKWIDSVEVWRGCLNLIPALKSKSSTLVIVSPVVTLPPEIARYISVMDFDLPTKEELGEMFDEMADENGCAVSDEKRTEIINAGIGLTAYEFENAMFLSYATEKGQVLPSIVHKQKEQLIRQNSTLTVGQYPNSHYANIIGMDRVKDFVLKMHKKGGRGILLLGVPGAGKSEFAKATANETGKLPIELDFGNLQNKYVGETERLTREALKAIDNMSPAILFVDEIEKGLAGVSGQSGDSGTSQRQGGQFLKWLQDHDSDVYVIATSNDISKLPPEYVRAERWDAIFFIDLPTEEEASQLMNLYAGIYNVDLDAQTVMPDITNWTGAEIKSLNKLASKLDCSLIDAAEYVTPIAKTMDAKIKSLRDWAKGRAVSASRSSTNAKKATAKSATATTGTPKKRRVFEIEPTKSTDNDDETPVV